MICSGGPSRYTRLVYPYIPYVEADAAKLLFQICIAELYENLYDAIFPWTDTNDENSMLHLMLEFPDPDLVHLGFSERVSHGKIKVRTKPNTFKLRWMLRSNVYTNRLRYFCLFLRALAT